MTPFAISRDSTLHADGLEPGARPRRDPVPLGLERRRRARLRGRARVPGDEGRRRADDLPRRARGYGPRRMASRSRRGARLRRAARGRAGVVALACALYLGAGLLATWPGARHLDTSFMAEGLPAYGEAAPGDHLQTGYNLWLVGHQLEHGRAPWRDPYSFQPEVEPRWNLAGWPFGYVYWPLERALGTVLAWNAFVLLGFLGAGGLTALWLRELGLRRGAALAGGLAFALAPYLQTQWSAGHLLAWSAMLLPLSLYAARAGDGAARTGGSSSPAQRSPRSRSRASSTSRWRRSRSSAATRSSGSAGRRSLGAARRSRPGSSPTCSPSGTRRARAAASSGRSSTTRRSAPTSSRGTRTSSRRSSTSAGRSSPWPLAGLAFAPAAPPATGSPLVLGLGALVPILFALGSNLPGYHDALAHPPGPAPHARARTADAGRLSRARGARRGRRLAPALARHRGDRRLLLLVELPLGMFHETRRRREQPRLCGAARRAARTAARAPRLHAGQPARERRTSTT